MNARITWPVAGKPQITRNNANPDICNYYWTYSTATRPPGNVPAVGSGFRYFAGNGETEVFDF
ncbi:MAG: hypothetical protein ACE37N_05535 [Pseudohongiellaceae bacterium]